MPNLPALSVDQILEVGAHTHQVCLIGAEYDGTGHSHHCEMDDESCDDYECVAKCASQRRPNSAVV